METTPLLEKTFELLDASTETQREIADGSGVNYHWLAKFSQRLFTSPGIVNVQKIHDYLAGKKQERAA